MDPNKLQQFVNAALAKGHSYDDVTKFIDAQQKMQSILTRIEQGLTPEESKLQETLTEETGKKAVGEIYDIKKEKRELEIFKEKEKIKAEQPSEAEEKRKRGLTDADRIVSLLEDKYFGGNQGQSIGYGKGTGISKNLELMTAFGETISPELEDISSYRALRDSARPAFARAMGDVGNLSEPEQRAAIKNIPDIYQTRGQALAYFRDVRRKLGLSERNIEKEIPTKLTTQQFPQESIISPQQQNPLMQLFQRGQQGDRTNLEANFLGKLLFPRASEVQSRQNRGEQVGLGERVGVAGETAANVLPFLGPGGLAMRLGLSGASRGLTEPGADVEKRLLEGGKQGLMGLLLGKGGQLAGKILRPIKTFGTAKNKAAEALEKEGGRIGDSKPLQVVSKDMLKAKIPDYTEAPLIKKLASGTGIKPTEGTRLLEMIRNKVYTKGGDEKTNQAAAYYDVLRKTLRGEFSQKAPDVIKNISRQRAVYKAGDFAKKGLFYAGPTAGLLYLASQIGQLGKGENR